MTRFRVLAVDDDPINLHIIGETLFDSGLDLVFASGGAAALEVLNGAAPFDLMILDRMMPGLDGMQLLRQLKASPRHAKLHVVMQTAAATPEQVAEGLSAGAHYYLTKPYTPSALRTIVRAAIEDVQRARELEEQATLGVETMRMLDRAVFGFRSIAQATRLGALLAQLCPRPGTAALGLVEVLVNAVEHGNLAISYAEKSALKRENRMEQELERRLAVPEYAARRARVEFERAADRLRFTVTDEGHGFEWSAFLEMDPRRAFDPNGRGIALARAMSFDRLEFQGSGNVVIATILLGEPAELTP
jgi:CheY-like chemotaxis protein